VADAAHEIAPRCARSWPVPGPCRYGRDALAPASRRPAVGRRVALDTGHASRFSAWTAGQFALALEAAYRRGDG